MKKITRWIPLFLFFFLTVFLFRQMIFFGKVPFAGNLLVSFYQPWKSYTWGNYGANGPANKPIGFDSLRIFYPLRSLTIESLRQFQLPLWNPYDFSGNTHLATYQTAVFFPLTPLFLFLPQIDAWSLVVFLAPFLASCFTYLFLRALSLSKKASVIGALSFGFSGGILVLIEESFMSAYSLLFLPLILLGVYKQYKKQELRWAVLIVSSIVASIFSGWFQSTLYVLILSYAWAIFLAVANKQAKRFIFVTVEFISGLLIAGIHLVPNIESYLYSARGTTDAKFLFDSYLLPAWHLITLIAPDFFGNPGTYNYFDTGFYYEKILTIGVVGLFLGLFSFFTLKKAKEEWFFTAILLVTLSLGLSLPTSWFILYYLHLPLLSTILPSRIFLISAFCLSTLAAYGMESLKKPNKLSFFATCFVFGIVLISAWKFLLLQKQTDPTGHFATISLRNFILPTIFVVATTAVSLLFFFRQKTMQNIAYILLVCIALVSIVYFSSKYLYFSEKAFTFPQTPVLQKLSQVVGTNRFWSFGPGYIERNFATQYHVSSPEGYDSFYIRSYGELIEASKNNGKFTTDIPRADAQLTGVSTLSEIISNQLLYKMLNLLGVKYILAKPTNEDTQFLLTDRLQHFGLFWTDGKYAIYENKNAQSRAFFVDSYIVQPSPQKQLAAIFNQQTNLGQTVVLDTNPRVLPNATPLLAKASITSYSPQKVIISATTNKTALLVLTDNMYPGWNAYIDNKPTKIFTADHTFRSIIVPKGKHTIVFSFQPLSITIGMYTSLVGILLFIFTGFTITKATKARKP